MNISKGKPSPESSLNRSCDNCRYHKIRCCPGSNEASKVCKRCQKMDRPCIFTTPQKRKQRKRTDTRVAELEREVQAMRNLFDHKKNGNGSEIKRKKQTALVFETCDESEEPRNLDTSVSGWPTGNVNSYSPPDSSPHSSTGNVPTYNPSSFSPDSDVIDRGIITIEQANDLLTIYNEDVVNHYHPVIIFSPQTTAEELRRTKPTLFLSVIASAAGKVSPTLLSILNSEALAAYAHRTVVNGEKSLELVQAMAITCIWYNPPGSFSRLKFYEYIHMAVNMAMDLGYGTNPRSARNRRADMSSTSALTDIEVEQRRVFLICYVISVTAAISLRRPNMLRYNVWIDECLETLPALPQATSHDLVIVAWVRLSKIIEDFHSRLSFEDLGNISNLSDPQTQMMVSGFEKALENWKKSFYHIDNKTLLMAYHHSQIYLHELSLHDDHLPENFRPPYTMTLLSIHIDPAAKSSHIQAISASVCNAHSLIDIFLSMSTSELRSVPVLIFVRVVYALVIMLKIYISSKSPRSKIGAFVNTDSIRLGFYLESVINKLVEATGTIECRSPLAFIGTLLWIRIWYKLQEHEPTFTIPTNLPPRPEACAIPPLSYRAFAEDSFMNGRMIAEIRDSLPSEDSVDMAVTFPPDDKSYTMMFDQEFEPFELIGLDADFAAYNADMNIVKPTDEGFTSPNYDWGFSFNGDGTV